MGLDVDVPPESAVPGGKPEEISDREVEAWLQVFHDDPNSKIPPPNLPKPKPRKSRQKSEKPVVRKSGDLTSEEVDSWLNVFSEGATQPQKGNRTAEPDEAHTGSKHEPARPSAKLIEQSEKFAPAEGQGKADLPEEDLELWQRLFGEET
jgi:hypothetical protein